MILHCVFCHFRDDISEADKTAALKALEAFSLTLDGVESFKFGPNKDFEKKSQDYDQGFVIGFANEDALHHYAEHPTHKKLGSKLAQLCQGGGDGIIVFDLDV